MGGRSILVAVAIAAGLGVACLSSLPSPTHCPPAAKHEAGNCAPAPTMPGCLDASCLTGPRRDPLCGGSIECPDDPATCYPAGDCPKAVTDVVTGRKVTCVRLAFGDVQSMNGRAAGACVTGCTGCAAVCDGVGPVVAIALPDGIMPGDSPLSLWVHNLAALLPATGQLGVYIRHRGIGTVGVVTLGPGGSTTSPIVGTTFASFAEDVFLESGFPTWKDHDHAPNEIALVPLPGATLIEIDCIIPFVVSP